MRLALALALALAVAAPATATPPRHLLVIGDSLAYDNRPYLRHELPHWGIQTDIDFARSAGETAHDLRRLAETAPLPPVIHVSSGTGDDPGEPRHFQRTVRRLMRIVGPDRCIVWANVWRLRLEEPTFATLNFVLAAEAVFHPNLRVVDWHTMVEAHLDWLVDLVHVDAAGNRARAAAVAHEVRACRSSLKP